ncbi:HlyD family secretion protein [Azomonas agilis]|uniref:HlyD family secretion protein n=1 Tax=Azomonas agilis TaxID=116849 RepID=A0A562IY70_9GAMM|nr:biotin/lipoyl-binding protein [Azomonas agilis]TWH75780.1 HlyD family secretion protein [Azomonas agilis]
MTLRSWLKAAGISLAIATALGFSLWQKLQPDPLGDHFAKGNGRIEATEIDIATKLAGRLVEVLVDEGDFVQPGQILARMDTDTLTAQLNQAKAQVRQAETAILTAQAKVAQRTSELAAAEATIQQRQAELNAAEKRFKRTASLVKDQAMSRQQYDDDLANRLSAQAAHTSAKAQALSAQAAIEAARSEVTEAQANLEAAKASVQRFQVDIDDSQLKTHRVARVQYRVTEVGEVLGAGGKVLNLVDLTDVYMTFFLPTQQAGRVALGAEAHLILDAAPQYVIPARISYVASIAQFTPKTVETASEREKLMFRIKARIDPQLLKKHLEQVKTGLPGTAYVKLDAQTDWPEHLRANVQL